MPNNILPFLAEQMNFIPFYYVQDVYQKITNRKASIASVNGIKGSGGGGALSPSEGILISLK